MSGDSLVFPPTREGDTIALQALIDAGLVLHLFTNRPTPGPNLTARDFVEAAFPGYKPIDLPPSAWNVEPGRGDSPVAAYAAYQTFVRSRSGEPEVIQGYYLTNRAGKYVQACWVPDGPWDVVRNNEGVQVRPVLVMPTLG